MPLSPEEASQGSVHSAEYILLCNEIDRQLAGHGSASVDNPSMFGQEALHSARKTYVQLGWYVNYQEAGQFGIPELLSIRPMQRKTMSDEDVARLFHDTYERHAPDHGYETRKESAVPWESVPSNYKSLMIAVSGVMAEAIRQELS
jgi:hypothetical protein